MITKTCSFCGSEKITIKVKMYCDSSCNFPLRAMFKNPKKSFIRPNLPAYFYADICDSCGTLVRIYSEEPPSDWETGNY